MREVTELAVVAGLVSIGFWVAVDRSLPTGVRCFGVALCVLVVLWEIGRAPR